MAESIVFKFITQSDGGGGTPSAGGGSSKRTIPKIPKRQSIPFAEAVGPRNPSKSSVGSAAMALSGSSIAPRSIKAVGSIASAGVSEARSLSAVLGPVGVGIAVIGAAVTAAGLAVVALRAAVRSKIASAKDFSPELTGALARNEVRAIRANITTANRLGGNLAKLEDASGRIGVAVQSATDNLMEPIIEAIVPVAHALASVIEAADKSGIFEFLGDAIALIVPSDLARIVAGEINKIGVGNENELFLFFQSLEYLAPENKHPIEPGVEGADFRFLSNDIPQGFKIP